MPSIDSVAEELLYRQLAKESLIDFSTYIDPTYETPYHIRVLIEHLEAVERGEIRNLIVTMPPRHGKSKQCSILFPCWYLGRHPTEYIVQAGYAESIALTHSRQARDIFANPNIENVFEGIKYRPERESQRRIIPERQAASEWGTVQGGRYYAVGVGGGLTGRGFSVGLIDDPVKDRAEAESQTIRDNIWYWYTNVFRTREAPGARKIIINTRWHTDDLVGRLLKADDPKADQWTVLHMPAISPEGKALWPERYDVNWLIQTRTSIGSSDFTAIYQGSPTIAKGNIFKREWWQDYSERPIFRRVIHSWDTAFKTKDRNDYSACTVWGETQTGIYLLDVFRQKLEFPELERAAKILYDRDRPSVVLVEDKASGQSLIQSLKRGTRIPLLPIKVDSDKTARAYAATPSIEAGRVYLPKSAPWLYDYLEEMSAFPNGEHDDMVDTTTQVLNWLRNHTTNESMEEPEPTARPGVLQEVY